MLIWKFTSRIRDFLFTLYFYFHNFRYYLEKGGEGAVNAYRGRRATASSMAISSGLMSIFLVLFAYRLGQKWAWWALLISLGLPLFLSLTRLFILGSAQGASAAGIILVPLLLGLLAGVPYMFFRRSEDAGKKA